MAPFTAGASLAATAAGTALAVGEGVTSFTASMVQHGWDKSQTKEGEDVTKNVCKQAQILAHCLKMYCDTLTEFKDYSVTPKGKQPIDELKAIDCVYSNVTAITLKSGSKAVSLNWAGRKVTQAVRLERVNCITPLP